jgi:hypothetical protein
METARRVGVIATLLTALLAAGCGVGSTPHPQTPSIDPDHTPTVDPTHDPTVEPGPDPGPVPTNAKPSIPDATASKVDAVPATVVADGKATAIVTVTVVDGSGRPVPGATVTLVSSAPATITPPTVKSSPSGVAVFQVASTSAASHVLTATADAGGRAIVLARKPTVVFTAPTWTVGGTVAGLTGTGLTLATAGQANLVVAAGATTFQFGNEVPAGTAYAISIIQQPSSPAQRCVLANERGTVDAAPVTAPAVTCVDAQTTTASLTLSTASVTVAVGGSTTVTAVAVEAGGAVAPVSAVAADPTVAGVSVANGAASATVTINALKTGSTTVTVTNTADPSPSTSTKTIAVTVATAENLEGYGAISGRLYPTPKATSAYVDGELSITFDAAPTLGASGSIEIYSLADGAQVDKIAFANEAQVVSGTTINVGAQLARVSGNTVYFTPHFGKLAYGASYYVGITSGAISGTLNGKSFSGFSNQRTVASWRFTTRAAPSIGATITVDGAQAQASANFRTLGGALMWLAAHPPSGNAVKISVAKGTYVELPHYRPSAGNKNLTVTISGPAGNTRGDTAVIQYANGEKLNVGGATRAAFYFTGAHLVLENLTFKNTAVRAQLAQAEALYFASGAGYRLAANNCTFSSHQDTIQTTGQAWIFGSNIEGNTDFIWGYGDVTLVEKCSLRVINDSAGATYSIFVSRTGSTAASAVGKGYVLKDSTVAVDAGISAAYGRDPGGTGFYDQVALVNNTFTGSGKLASGLWVTTTAPSRLGDSTYVGWKAWRNTGLGAESAATASGTAASIASVGSEYDTRDHILNRVITISGGAPSGFAAASTTWDTTSLAAAWGAP